MKEYIEDILERENMFILVSRYFSQHIIHVYTIDGKLINSSAFNTKGVFLTTHLVGNKTCLRKYKILRHNKLPLRQLDKIMANTKPPLLIKSSITNRLVRLAMKYVKNELEDNTL